MICIFVRATEKIHGRVTTIIGVLYDHHFLLINIDNMHNLKNLDPTGIVHLYF